MGVSGGVFSSFVIFDMAAALCSCMRCQLHLLQQLCHAVIVRLKFCYFEFRCDRNMGVSRCRIFSP